MQCNLKIVVLIVASFVAKTYGNNVVFDNANTLTCPEQQTEARVPVTDNCPFDNTKILHPSIGYGSMNCIDLEKDRNRCKKYDNVTCVGTKTKKTGKCYDWHCYNFPKNGDFTVDINGPDYNRINIRIKPLPPVWVVIVCLSLIVLGFVLAPELMFGICIGNSWGKDDNQTSSFSS